MKLIICILASISVLALKCPELSCSSELSDSICASITGNQISVNLCTGKYSCSLQQIMSAYHSGQSEVKCEVRPYREYYIEEGRVDQISNSLCSVDYPNKKLKHSHPIQFNDNKDCKLSDGSTWFCKCSTNGKSYCAKAPGDDEYQELRQAGCKKELDKLLYYSLKIELYPEAEGLDKCDWNERLADMSMLYQLEGGLVGVFDMYEYESSMYLCVFMLIKIIILL